MSNSTSPDMIDPNHFVLLATQTLAYKQEDLDKLRASNKYVKFDLSEVDSSEALPMGASLINNNLTEAKLQGANLTNADLTNANLSESNLADANLFGASLINANLTEAKLSWAYLSEANMREANLYRASMREATLCNTIDPEGRKINKDC